MFGSLLGSAGNGYLWSQFLKEITRSMIRWFAAFIGYMVYRFPGAIVGFLIGSLLDNFIGGKKSDISWNEVVAQAMLERVALTENAHYATPIIHFDKSKEKGHPFAYHVYGTAITTVTLDCLRGAHEIDSVKIVHDFGKSMNIGIDIGQIEGALAQGIGWMTMEEIALAISLKKLVKAFLILSHQDMLALLALASSFF